MSVRSHQEYTAEDWRQQILRITAFHKQEKQKLAYQHNLEITHLKQTHQREIEKLKDELQECERELFNLRNLEKQHYTEIQNLKRRHWDEKLELEAEHKRHIDSLTIPEHIKRMHDENADLRQINYANKDEMQRTKQDIQKQQAYAQRNPLANLRDNPHNINAEVGHAVSSAAVDLIGSITNPFGLTFKRNGSTGPLGSKIERNGSPDNRRVLYL